MNDIAWQAEWDDDIEDQLDRMVTGGGRPYRAARALILALRRCCRRRGAEWGRFLVTACEDRPLLLHTEGDWTMAVIADRKRNVAVIVELFSAADEDDDKHGQLEQRARSYCAEMGE